MKTISSIFVQPELYLLKVTQSSEDGFPLRLFIGATDTSLKAKKKLFRVGT